MKIEQWKKDIIITFMKNSIPNFEIDCWGKEVLEDEDSFVDKKN